MSSLSLPTSRRLLVTALLIGAVFCAVAAKASAYVYWSNEGLGNIGRANTDGTEPNQTFMSAVGDSIGLASDGTHIFWANAAGGIGRANLDGSSPEPMFIAGLETPISVTVDSGHVYWSSTFGNKIGRANLDGTVVEPEFITSGLDYPWQLASAGNHLYWAENGGGAIGRANLDGTEVDNSFIGASAPRGLVAHGGFLYWNSLGDEKINRAKLDGTEVTPGLVDQIGNSTEIAVDDGHIYWTSRSGGGTIGRANADGSGVEREFIAAGQRPQGLLVDPLPLPPAPPAPPPPPPTPGDGNGSGGNAGGGTGASGGGTAQGGQGCVRATATASTFTPAPAPGEVVPGIRLRLGASTPSQLQVGAILNYRAGGAAHQANLGTYALHVSGSSNLRIALPTSLRSVLDPNSRVRVGLKITATPDSSTGSCGKSYDSSAAVTARVVNVLVSKAQSHR